ncbi:Sir2-type HDAC (histone deacetylase) [Haladaptatus paucihalophilus DX253]|uniref:NAD-dependent deacetylase n=1 Tax=Haladaptatus paucihalophilus DX253 TaxID=797209 RepID=E7QV76_HALPU|nr:MULTISPECIES: Sir2 family NAD-dependent protein deacetylase [Haladaptatus]EFW91594.1 Sir2-type HDAC (histone deacetylase) [Haladaptatus paucihalophilus DX253]GKZ16134.1 NAD-dependent deacetylase [Haladaptatus sp. T7]SHL23556.1 NAD-dependent deacetylase [Haladaptatus paucihalophilus DX253]
MNDIARLADRIRDAETVVAFTGAGMSTASGIPDFRSDSGLWNRFDPEDFYYQRFRADPAAFWSDRLALHETMFGDDIEPNEAHDALAELADDGQLDAIITQNTDGLHACGGRGDSIAAELLELHGNAHRVVCEECGRRTDAAPVRRRIESGELPPRCGDCGGLFKPDVVLFGERLDEDTLYRARRYAQRADVFLAIGSSLTVEPAASLPRTADRGGATTAVINFDETPFSPTAAFDVRGDVTDVLPDLRASVVE